MRIEIYLDRKTVIILLWGIDTRRAISWKAPRIKKSASFHELFLDEMLKTSGKQFFPNRANKKKNGGNKTVKAAAVPFNINREGNTRLRNP